MATRVCLPLCARGAVVAPATRRAVINPYRNVLRMEILLTVNWAFTEAGKRPYPGFGRRATPPGGQQRRLAGGAGGGLGGFEPLHGRGEGVDLVERRVQVRGDPDALVFVVDNRRDDDPRRVPQRGRDDRRGHALDAHGADGAGLRRVEAGMDAEASLRLE